MMFDENKWERVEETDPNRCQAMGKNFQCPFKAIEGNKFCPRHAGLGVALAARRASDMFRLDTYQARVAEFASHDELKNLRGEIGILRMTLEEIINQTGGDRKQLLCYSGKISDMIMKISVLIKTCHRLDTQLGMMLDRDKVMLIAQKIVEIVSEAVPDQSILDKMGEKLVETILEISKQ